MIYYLISTTCISPVRRKWTNPKINKKYLLTIYGKNVVKREGVGVLIVASIYSLNQNYSVGRIVPLA